MKQQLICNCYYVQISVSTLVYLEPSFRWSCEEEKDASVDKEKTTFTGDEGVSEWLSYIGFAQTHTHWEGVGVGRH